MKGVVVGIGLYTKKDSDKKRAHVYVKVPAPEGFIGEMYQHLNCSRDVLASDPKTMIGQTYIIDTDGGFGNGFYKV